MEMTRIVDCVGCGQVIGVKFDPDSSTSDEDICPPCLMKYPPALRKARVDPFDYALQLSGGEIIFFESCEFAGDWIHLIRPTRVHDQQDRPPTGVTLLAPLPFDRGMDVRLDAIVWCADAPYGS